ncbi:MAG: 5'/3'-nucleotidase SurE [Candidatus Hodarchaeota archaeon]
MYKILVANDDGIKSWGLSALYKAASKVGHAVVVTPQHQKSATGKSLTINSILRYMDDNLVTGEPAFAIDGLPADSVPMGAYILGQKPQLVVSGVNLGENCSIHNILTSGTCAIGYEAATNRIPAICFSSNVPRKTVFNHVQKHDFTVVERLCTEIIKSVLTSEWPKDLAFLNVNFPYNVRLDTPIHFTKPTIRTFTFQVTEGRDPRENSFYWIIGDPFSEFPVGTDAWATKQRKEISISPISLNPSVSFPEITWSPLLNVQNPKL